MKLGPHTKDAVRDLGIALDARGLIPLAEARRRVRAAKVFARGKSYRIPNQVSQPTDADYLWGALLSLDSAHEFVREASRIVWKFPPSGFDNVAPHERFGDAIVPWLATFVDEKGRLTPNLRFVVACLVAIGDRSALEVILRIVTTRTTDGREIVRRWVERHGTRGRKALAALAREGHATLTEAAILDVLDAAASSTNDYPLPWPTLGASVGHFEPHAMRVIAARAKKGDDWGILVEVVQGDLLQGPRDEYRWPMTVQHYRYGSRVPTGGRYLEDCRPIGMHRVLPRGFRPASFDGVRVVGPKGTKPIVLSDALVKKLKLAPGRSCSKRIEDWPSVIAVRARLAQDPDALWTDARGLARKVLGIADPIVVVASDAFEHVSGPKRLPSASKTFQSIAAAIVTRDGKRFRPGRPNVSWRDQGRGRIRP